MKQLEKRNKSEVNFLHDPKGRNTGCYNQNPTGTPTRGSSKAGPRAFSEKMSGCRDKIRRQFPGTDVGKEFVNACKKQNIFQRKKYDNVTIFQRDKGKFDKTVIV